MTISSTSSKQPVSLLGNTLESVEGQKSDLEKGIIKADKLFTYVDSDGNKHKTFTNPDEWLLGGGKDCNFCYSCCSYQDKRNDAAFSCIGKTLCFIPSLILCLGSLGNVCNPFCKPFFMTICGVCCHPCLPEPEVYVVIPNKIGNFILQQSQQDEIDP